MGKIGMGEIGMGLPRWSPASSRGAAATHPHNEATSKSWIVFLIRALSHAFERHGKTVKSHLAAAIQRFLRRLIYCDDQSRGGWLGRAGSELCRVRIDTVESIRLRGNSKEGDYIAYESGFVLAL
ncbi:hypothetical protein NKH55_18660 [Mesorhizobium opportunistum]|uniref:hypothetical protein n=1 Tax=Mesorhizobium opportunistum TaxID=593909 RepID=UPI003334DE5E